MNVRTEGTKGSYFKNHPRSSNLGTQSELNDNNKTIPINIYHKVD